MRRLGVSVLSMLAVGILLVGAALANEQKSNLAPGK